MEYSFKENMQDDLEKLKQRVERLSDDEDFIALMEYLKDSYFINNTTYCGEGKALAFFEGQRYVVLDLMFLMDKNMKVSQNA